MSTATLREHKARLDPVNHLPRRPDSVAAGIDPRTWEFAREILAVVDPAHYRRSAIAASALYCASLSVSGENRVHQTTVGDLIGVSDNAIRRHMPRVAETALTDVDVSEYGADMDVLRHVSRTGTVKSLSW